MSSNKTTHSLEIEAKTKGSLLLDKLPWEGVRTLLAFFAALFVILVISMTAIIKDVSDMAMEHIMTFCGAAFLAAAGAFIGGKAAEALKRKGNTVLPLGE